MNWLRSNPVLSVQHLGDSVDMLKQLAVGSLPFSEQLAATKAPVVIVGSEALQRADGDAVMKLFQQVSVEPGVCSRSCTGSSVRWGMPNVGNSHTVLYCVVCTTYYVLLVLELWMYGFCTQCRAIMGLVNFIKFTGSVDIPDPIYESVSDAPPLARHGVVSHLTHISPAGPTLFGRVKQRYVLVSL